MRILLRCKRSYMHRRLVHAHPRSCPLLALTLSQPKGSTTLPTHQVMSTNREERGEGAGAASTTLGRAPRLQPVAGGYAAWRPSMDVYLQKAGANGVHKKKRTAEEWKAADENVRAWDDAAARMQPAMHFDLCELEGYRCRVMKLFFARVTFGKLLDGLQHLEKRKCSAGSNVSEE